MTKVAVVTGSNKGGCYVAFHPLNGYFIPTLRKQILLIPLPGVIIKR